MANSHGSHIWFELMTGDPEAAGDFYSRVIGWSVGGFGGATVGGADDYRILSAPDGEGVGGVMKAPGPGMQPGWFGYVGVDDVDATAARIAELGGAIHMPPTTLDGVGRLAMAADPQGAVFYIMRGASPEASTAFKRMALGHGEWNELITSDDAAALDFYAALFGWKKDGGMPMGPGREYSFLSHDGGVFGALMQADGEPPHWNRYFRVGQIDAVAEKVRGAGGTVLQGPHEVPGGDMIIVAADPQGATFGCVGNR